MVPVIARCHSFISYSAVHNSGAPTEFLVLRLPRKIHLYLTCSWTCYTFLERACFGQFGDKVVFEKNVPES